MGLPDIANFRDNPNFIEWMATVNHCPESRIRSLTAENYLGGYCEDWALYFAIRYNVPMLFLDERHDLVKIGGLYYDGANPEGAERLSDLAFVRDPANGLSDKTEDELEAMLRVDDDWKSYPALANYIGIIEKAGHGGQTMDDLKMAKELVRLAKSLVAMPVDEHWNGNTEEFEDWYYKAIDTLFRQVNAKLATFNMPFDYSVVYDESYETCREELEQDESIYKDSIGVAMFSNQTDPNVLPVAIDNEKVMMVYFDSFNPAAVSSELETTIWHEVAHGLVERFMDEFADAGTEDPEFEDLANGDIEQTCEDFGRAAGNLNQSNLGKWIRKNADGGWTNIYGEDEE